MWLIWLRARTANRWKLLSVALLRNEKKSPFTLSRERALYKSGGTYFRTCSTIIGSKCLTTVFEMGTGVTTLICSPEKITPAYSPGVT